MVIFYTSIEGLEPTLICYPYIVINPWSFSEGLRYVQICKDKVKSVLVDTVFNYMKLRDYPEWYIQEYVRIVRKLAVMYSNRYEIYYVIPDIPCDYPGREHLYPWNVTRTIEYIEMFRARYIDQLRPAKAIAVVQGRRDDIRSVIDTYRKYEHIYNEFEIIALGPICTTKKWSLLARLILAFDRNVSKPFHAFGIHIKALEYVMKWRLNNFRSFDSSAYKYVNSDDHRLAKSRREIYESFLRFIDKLRRLGVVVE